MYTLSRAYIRKKLEIERVVSEGGAVIAFHYQFAGFRSEVNGENGGANCFVHLVIYNANKVWILWAFDYEDINVAKRCLMKF